MSDRETHKLATSSPDSSAEFISDLPDNLDNYTRNENEALQNSREQDPKTEKNEKNAGNNSNLHYGAVAVETMRSSQDESGQSLSTPKIRDRQATADDALPVPNVSPIRLEVEWQDDQQGSAALSDPLKVEVSDISGFFDGAHVEPPSLATTAPSLPRAENSSLSWARKSGADVNPEEALPIATDEKESEEEIEAPVAEMKAYSPGLRAAPKSGSPLESQNPTFETPENPSTENNGDTTIISAIPPPPADDAAPEPDINERPTDIVFTGNDVDENASGAVVATLTASDPDAGDSVSFSLAEDASGLFEIVGDQLKLKDGVSLDHETQSAYEVTVEATDAAGLTYQETVSINVADVNEAPVDIALSGTDVDENASGAVVATLSASDPDAGDSVSFSLAEDASGLFEIVGDQLKLKDGVSLDHETQSAYEVTVEATDAGGLTYQETVSIVVNDLTETPAPILGTENDDDMFGTADDDAIYGYEGDDRIYGRAGDDIIIGGLGDDNLHGEDGDDTFIITGPGQGFDRIVGNAGNDRIIAGANGTQIGLTDFKNWVETISANGYDNVTILGTSADNILNFAATTLDGIVSIDGGAGDDRIAGSSEADVIIGGAGNDNLTGEGGDDTFIITGTNEGFDRIIGNGGDDIVIAGADGTQIGLSEYDNNIETFSANGYSGVTIMTTDAAETLDFSTTTLSGIESINSGGGDDTLIGSAGDDTLIGGEGDDLLIGGDGADIFLYNLGDGSDQIDGGSGGWTDMIQFADGLASLGEFGVDWTLELTQGEILSQDENGIDLSDNADGIITLSDGTTIEFTDLEQII